MSEKCQQATMAQRFRITELPAHARILAYMCGFLS
jgi:hypothetical protein